MMNVLRGYTDANASLHTNCMHHDMHIRVQHACALKSDHAPAPASVLVVLISIGAIVIGVPYVATECGIVIRSLAHKDICRAA
jgi:hypothetical protein